MDRALFERRPIVVALAGPNGAGKSTFFETQLAATGLRFVNADFLAAGLALDPYIAAQVADALRRSLINSGKSFIFETVFSDPVGDKLAFLEDAASKGYTVVLCFIGLSSAEQSNERVAMRASRGGHDVPIEKLAARFPRTLANLKTAIARLPTVLVFDNSDFSQPFRQIAIFEQGKPGSFQEPLPNWLETILQGKPR